jgi:hypothetical protein
MKLTLALPIFFVLGCTANQSGNAELTTTSLVASLRSAGLSLEDAGMVEQPFFTVPAHVYTVEGDLQIYEFRSAADAERAAAEVAPNGTSIGTSQVSWMAAPHFFRKDRLVVNYLGSSPNVLAELQRILGAQFAGQ